MKTEIELFTFDDFGRQVDALYSGKIGAIIINEVYRETILEIFEDFNDRTILIKSYQMEVIKGMIKKATSPAIIIKYNNILNSVSGTFETNMRLEEITNLIKI